MNIHMFISILFLCFATVMWMLVIKNIKKDLGDNPPTFKFVRKSFLKNLHWLILGDALWIACFTYYKWESTTLFSIVDIGVYNIMIIASSYFIFSQSINKKQFVGIALISVGAVVSGMK